MRTTMKALTLTIAGSLIGAGSAYAHPGHVTEGGLFHTIAHILGSPYHMAVVVAVIALAVAWGFALRSRASARREPLEEKRPT